MKSWARQLLMPLVALLSGCALMQPSPRPDDDPRGATARDRLSVVAAEVSAALRADVQRALEIAQQAGDPAGVACATAILGALDRRQVPLAPKGIFSTYMLARELKHGERVPSEVHQACASLVLDAEVVLLKLGLKFGGVPVPP